MTSHLDSHKTTDIKPEMLSGVQTGNGTPHGKYNIRGIAHARTKRKDDIFMQNFTYIMELGQETCTLTKRTRRWTYYRFTTFFGFNFRKIISGLLACVLLFRVFNLLSHSPYIMRDEARPWDV